MNVPPSGGRSTLEYDMRFTVAVAQFAPEKGQVSANLDRIAQIAMQASDAGAELVVFSETVTSGYFVEGGVLECSLEREELRAELAARLTGLKRPLDITVGFYERLDETLFNSAAYLEAGPDGVVLRQVYQKFFLPTYGVFDEERFVTAGNDVAVFDTRLGRFALLICEDIWHSVLPTICAVRGAQMLLVPTASPARGFEQNRPVNTERFERLLRGIAEEHTVYCVQCGLLGFEGGKGFVGMSCVVDGQGQVVGQSPMLEEHLLLAEIDLDLLAVARANSPLLGDLKGRWSALMKLAQDS